MAALQVFEKFCEMFGKSDFSEICFYLQLGCPTANFGAHSLGERITNPMLITALLILITTRTSPGASWPGWLFKPAECLLEFEQEILPI